MSRDELSGCGGDGAIRRVALDGGSPRTVVSRITRSRDLLVDAQYVHWNAGLAGEETLRFASKGDGSGAMELASAPELAWAHDAAYLYFAAEESAGAHEVTCVTASP